jgi:ATP-dependent exoDNAse (exonuclease V) alpha subunit
LNAVANDYLDDMAKGIDTIVLTATNRDRTDLNQSIRNNLVQKAVVEKGNAFDTLQNAGLSGSKRRFADNYRIGQQVFFQKESGPIKRGTQAEITGFDPQKNSLTLQIKPSKNTDKPIEHTINLFKEATKIQAFNVVQKNFGVGDRIITLKNDKMVGVENGKIGIIQNMDSEGNISVFFVKDKIKNAQNVFKMDLKKQYISATFDADFGRIRKGTQCHVIEKNLKEKTISIQYMDENRQIKQAKIQAEDLKHLFLHEGTERSFNLKNYSYIDHAYSVTSYKSQGCTVDVCRFVHDHSQQTNYNEAYVAITRARFDAVVYTSDPEKLIEHASKEQEKESIIQWQKQAKEIPQPSIETKPETPVQPAQEKRKEATYGLEI